MTEAGQAERPAPFFSVVCECTFWINRRSLMLNWWESKVQDKREVPDCSVQLGGRLNVVWLKCLTPPICHYIQLDGEDCMRAVEQLQMPDGLRDFIELKELFMFCFSSQLIPGHFVLKLLKWANCEFFCILKNMNKVMFECSLFSVHKMAQASLKSLISFLNWYNVMYKRNSAFVHICTCHSQPG